MTPMIRNVPGEFTDSISRSAPLVRLPDVIARPFEQIVAEYGPVVLRVCWAVVGPVDAEDAWSENPAGADRDLWDALARLPDKQPR